MNSSSFLSSIRIHSRFSTNYKQLNIRIAATAVTSYSEVVAAVVFVVPFSCTYVMNYSKPKENGNREREEGGWSVVIMVNPQFCGLYR